jgi:hypothetical protein
VFIACNEYLKPYEKLMLSYPKVLYCAFAKVQGNADHKRSVLKVPWHEMERLRQNTGVQGNVLKSMQRFG